MTGIDLMLSERERLAVERANASALRPVVFVHGLWLAPSSWDRWAALFDQAGHASVLAGWPGEPDDVETARAHPELYAHKTLGAIVDRHRAILSLLRTKPAIVGHSFGGLIAQVLAGRGLATVTVAISPAGFRGVLPLPFSALKSAWPALGNPLNRDRAVPLTFEQFRYAFANAVDEAEALELYRRFAVPADAEPLFQAAAANLNPWTEDKADVKTPARGPLLILAGERDHTVPPAVSRAAFRLQQTNPNPTEFEEIPSRGHSLTIDRGWREIAERSLAFVRRFA